MFYYKLFQMSDWAITIPYAEYRSPNTSSIGIHLWFASNAVCQNYNIRCD